MTHDLVSDFQARGLIHQSTDAARLREWLSVPGRRVYAGFDPRPTACTLGTWWHSCFSAAWLMPATNRWP